MGARVVSVDSGCVYRENYRTYTLYHVAANVRPIYPENNEDHVQTPAPAPLDSTTGNPDSVERSPISSTSNNKGLTAGGAVAIGLAGAAVLVTLAYFVVVRR